MEISKKRIDVIMSICYDQNRFEKLNASRRHLYEE